jgi:uncharacterized OB-fold protein
MTVIPSSTTGIFWAACNEGKLLLSHCDACGRSFYYPRTGCPFCGGEALSWRASTGLGSVFTYSHVELALATEWESLIPYTVLLVDLDEGVRMLSRLVGSDHRDVQIGDRVCVEFVKRGLQMLPYFKRGAPSSP